MFLSITGSRPGWSILRALCWRSTAMGECRDGEGMFESLAVPRVGGGLQYDAVLVDIMGSLTHESTTVGTAVHVAARIESVNKPCGNATPVSNINANIQRALWPALRRSSLSL
jgi:hypothetical protein